MFRGNVHSRITRAAQHGEVHPLVDALQNADLPEDRCSAAAALGDLVSYRVIPTLNQALSGDDGQVRQAAASALARVLASIDRTSLLALYPTLAEADQTRLTADLANRGGDQDIEILQAARSSLETAIRSWAVVGLVDRGDKGQFEELLRLIQNPPYELYREGVWFPLALAVFERMLTAMATDLPEGQLRELAALQDESRDVTYYLVDDPLYDAGHDTITLAYPRVRAIARQELERRGLSAED